MLVTPARNEAAFIEKTIETVLLRKLFCRPKWVIVNDGSTDDTAEIVAKYTAEHTWIELAEPPVRQEIEALRPRFMHSTLGIERVKDIRV